MLVAEKKQGVLCTSIFKSGGDIAVPLSFLWADVINDSLDESRYLYYNKEAQSCPYRNSKRKR